MDSVEYVLKLVLPEDIDELLLTDFEVIVNSRFQSFVNFHIGSLMFSILYSMDNVDCFGDVLQIQVVDSDETVKYVLNYFVDDRELSVSDNLNCAEANVSYQRVEINEIIDDSVDSKNIIYPLEL